MSAAVAQAKPAASRVQGIDADLSDLTLHDGRELAIALGGSVKPTPTLTRTIQGASSISLTINDPDDTLLESALLASRFDAELDGLHFRSKTCNFDHPETSLVLEERVVAKLRELKGPVKAYARRGQPNELTRAEFVIEHLLAKVKPAIPYFCPELHKRQPIKTEAQGKKGQEEAKANRGAGVGDVKGLTVKGEKATKAQIEAGDRALRVAESHHAPFRVCVALMEALIVEDCLGTLTGNWLQLIPSTASESGINPHDLESSVAGFLTGYINGEGGALAYFHAHPKAEPHKIAQEVQRSGAGAASNGAANYGPWQAEAREWVEAFEGGEGFGGSTEHIEPVTFEVEKGENYWQAIQRLAKDVNWRAFFVAGRFFFIDEIDLFRGMVRLAIDRDTPGIQKVKFKYNPDLPVTEVEIEAWAKQWSVPPGAVITLAGYGPASVGFGDAPVKADSKGRKAGVSSNRNAKTGEGRARYLVESIEGPLRDDGADARLVVIKARKPTAPLPESAAKRTGVSAGASGEMGTLEGTPEDIVNQVVDYAHSHGFPSVTRQSVREANAEHGPTVDGNISDHQGPPNVRWAADISNGTSTPEEAKLAAAIAEAFNIPWHGTLKTGELAEATHGGYRFQLIHNTMTGGDHFNHVHFGCAVA